MIKQSVLVVLLCCVSAFPLSAIDRNTAKAQKLINQKKYQLAEKEYLKALKACRDPAETGRILCALADTALYQGDPDRAFEYYRQGLGTPGNAGTGNTGAPCAEEGIRRLSTFMPVTNQELKKEVFKLMEEGDRYRAYNDLKGALDRYAAATVKAPYFLPAHLRAGEIYFKINEPAKARTELQLAILTGDTNAWFTLGRCFETFERDDRKALHCYRHAGSSASSFIAPISNSLVIASSAYRAMTNKRYEDAVTAYKEALAVRPLSLPLNIGLGQVFEAMNRDSDAVLQYQKAVMIAPSAGEGYYRLVTFYVRKNQNRQAETWFERGANFFDDGQRTELAAFLKK